MKNLLWLNPFVVLITTFPLELIYGSVGNSGKWLGANMTAFIHGERLECRFEVKTNDSCQGP